jgi:hypothetical protein
VPEDEREFRSVRAAAEDVEIGTTDTAHLDANRNLILRPWHGLGDVVDGEGMSR